MNLSQRLRGDRLADAAVFDASQTGPAAVGGIGVDDQLLGMSRMAAEWARDAEDDDAGHYRG